VSVSFVSVIRVREFRARGSEPVICELDCAFRDLSFDIWHVTFCLPTLTSCLFPIAETHNFALQENRPITFSVAAVLWHITLMKNSVSENQETPEISVGFKLFLL
jgi:hypothetical protein